MGAREFCREKAVARIVGLINNEQYGRALSLSEIFGFSPTEWRVMLIHAEDGAERVSHIINNIREAKKWGKQKTDL